MNENTGHLGGSPSGIRDKFVDFVLGRPLIALGVGLVLIVGLASGMPKITANFTHTAFLYEDDPLLQEFNRFERQFGNDDALVVVVHSPSGIFDVDSAKLLQSMTEKLWLIPDVIRVDSLANYSWVHSLEDDIEVEPLIPDDVELTNEILEERKHVALTHKQLPSYLISKDGNTALLYARIRPGFESPADTKTIVLAARKLLVESRVGDHEIYLTGGPTVNYAFREASEKDSSTLVPIVLLMAIIFLIALLRSIGGVVLPLLVIVTSIVAAMGIAGWTGIELTAVTIVLPQILIAVAIADSVHILSSFYRARRRGLEKVAAVRYTLSKNFIPTILTSLSTAAGFFAFSTSNLKPIFGLGILAGCGTFVAWFSSYLVMGPLMVWAPSWVKKRGEADELRQPGPRALKYVSFLRRHGRSLIVGYLIVCSGAVFMATRNRVNSDPYKYFAEDYPLRNAQDFIIANLSGVAVFEMRVSAGKEDGIKEPDFLRKVEELQNRMVGVEGVYRAVSMVDIFKEINRSLHGDAPETYVLPDSKELVGQEFLLYTMSLPQGMDVNDRVTVKHDALRITLISKITDSATWTRTAKRFETFGAELGLDVTVSGKMMLYQSMNEYVTLSFIQSVAIAIVLVSLILIIAFRSFKIGAIAMLPNVIPLLIGGAFLHILDQSLDIGTVLVCSVCLGIAVDDTIHILTNFQRHRRSGHDANEAIAMTLTHTGPALVVTTLVLVAAFGTLAFATFVPNVYFGVMAAVILSTALVTDLTFLPAVLIAVAPRPEGSVPKAKATEVADD